MRHGGEEQVWAARSVLAGANAQVRESIMSRLPASVRRRILAVGS